MTPKVLVICCSGLLVGITIAMASVTTWMTTRPTLPQNKLTRTDEEDVRMLTGKFEEKVAKGHVCPFVIPADYLVGTAFFGQKFQQRTMPAIQTVLGLMQTRGYACQLSIQVQNELDVRFFIVCLR